MDNDTTKLVLDQDYYMEGGLMVMTSAFHEKRGLCCGSFCRHCPFLPRHEAGATNIVGTIESHDDMTHAAHYQD